jgi:hypothetical protein
MKGNEDVPTQPVRDCIEQLRREHGLASEQRLADDSQRIASRVEERALLDEAYGVLRIVELWFAAGKRASPHSDSAVHGLVSELCRRMRGE